MLQRPWSFAPFSMIRAPGCVSRSPNTSAAFEAGEISWTKVREICRVATPETEDEWLMRAKRLTNRALEKMVRHKTGIREQDFLRIPMPADVMDVWKECEELAERMSGCELAPYQVLEAMTE